MNFPKTPLIRLMASCAIALASIASATLPTAVLAELVATPLRGDSRLVQFQYDADNTYLVLSKPKAVTHIQFAQDEVIQSIAAGDTAAWELTPTKNRKHLFVKPKFEDLDTSMTVLTDRRNYQFVLRSTGDGKKWYQRVSWLYETEIVLDVDAALDHQPTHLDVAPMAGTSSGTQQSVMLSQRSGGTADTHGCPSVGAGIRPESMSFNYEVKGTAPFRPQIVFDDGLFTYYRMPEGLQELPALFAVIDGSDFALVNYTVGCDYVIAQRLMESSVLKLGRAEVRISRVEPKKRSFFNRTEH
jgi:type IV secretory pathway VirB9-like protein